MFVSEVRSHWSAPAGDTNLDTDLISVITQQVDKAAVGHRSGDRHRFEFQLFLTDVAKARYGQAYLGVFDT